jgi:hypothetical protein
MTRKIIPIIGATWTLALAFFIVWLYVSAPASLREVATQARDTARLTTGTYEIDDARFRQGLEAFRRENFEAARDEWRQADPATRDARTQFYIAYSLYRQGWGRLFNDDALFNSALETVNRIDALDNSNTFPIQDDNLALRTPAELRAELQAGTTQTWGDLNPLKVIRERK